MNNIDELISRHLLGQSTPDDCHALAAWIRASPANADRIIRETFVHRHLRDVLHGQAALASVVGTPSRTSPPRQRRRLAIPRWTAMAVAAAVTFALLGISFSLFRTTPPSIAISAGPQLVAQIQAVWDHPLSNGPLSSDEFTLTAGLARLRSANGAEFVIAGPSTFRVEGDTLQLLQGRASVRSPSAAILRHGSIGLSGTGEFGLTVSADGGTALCRSGHVDVAGMERSSSNLTAGQSLSWGQTGAAVLPPPAWGQARLAERGTASAASALLADPALLLWCDLGRLVEKGDPSDALAADPLSSGDTSHVAGVPRAARLAAGRSADPSLCFTGQAGGVPIDIAGTYEELTLSAWVHLSQTTPARIHRGLLMSDGWGQPGQVHWQVKGADFRLSFFDRGDDEDVRYPASADAISTPGWHHLASVIRLRGAKRGVEHFVDGTLVARQPLANNTVPALRIGRATVGGWRPDAGHPSDDRTLDGDIDDVMVFGRALSPNEIQKLHEVLSAP